MITNPIKFKEFKSPKDIEIKKEEHDDIKLKKFIFSKNPFRNSEMPDINIKANNIKESQTLSKKNFPEKLSIFLHNKIEPIDKSVKIINKGQLIQAPLRYRPRNDMERIMDTLNKYSYGRISDDFIKKTLKGFGVGDAKKMIQKMNIDIDLDDSNYSQDGYESRDTKNTKKLTENKLEEVVDEISGQKKCYAVNEKKVKMNQTARKLIDELYTKTHFKALSSLAGNILHFIIKKHIQRN